MPVMTRRALLSRLTLSVPEAEQAHTLVQVFLRGGADTLNLLPPYADDRYHRLRPSLAVRPPGKGQDAGLRLDERYALHPEMRPLEAAFKEGRLGAVQAVGVENSSGSHFECQDQMEHGDPATGTPAGGGWLGRYLRLRARGELSALSAVAVGKVLPESLRGAPSASVLESLDDIAIKAPAGDPVKIIAALQSLYGADVTLLGARGVETLALFEKVSALQGKGTAPEHGAAYPQDAFGSGLREISRLIKARVGLQVACVDLGGWDTHFFQGSAAGVQAERIRTLATGLAAFEQDLRDYRAGYTVMITTEFGRRVYENASLGTDHGRGFALLALGEKVHGGRILGGWPIRADDEVNLNTPGPGGLWMETDCRHVFGEMLAATQGLSPSEVASLFPGLEFQPVGLMR